MPMALRHPFSSGLRVKLGDAVLRRATEVVAKERRFVLPATWVARDVATADEDAVLRAHDQLRGHRRYAAPTRDDVEHARQDLLAALRRGDIVAVRERGAPGPFTSGLELPSDDPAPPAASISEEKTTWFEVTVVDEARRPIAGLELALTVEGKVQRATTNSAGLVRLQNQTASFGSVQLVSVEQAKARVRERGPAPRKPKLPDDRVLELGPDAGNVAIEAEAPSVIVVVKPLKRVRLIGMHFDTNKAFLRESAMHGIRKVVEVYERNPNGTLLIVGHTDTVADEKYNLELSVERAEAIKAYFEDDVSAWESWFAHERPEQKRWGTIEIQHMIAALPCEPSIAGFQRFSNESRGTSLIVDGIAGPETRKALITAYMDLDGTTLPGGIAVEMHGCGEFFPADATADGVEDAENRRVEIFCFDDDVTPPVPGRRATKGEPEYEAWKEQVTQDIDFEVGDRVALHITLLDAERNPRAHVPFELNVAGEVLNGETNAHGQVDVVIASAAATATLVAEGQSYELVVRELASLDTIAGVQERLDNLAYSCASSGELDDETREALKSFQRDEGLPVTGAIDPPTKDQLKARYGH